MKLKWKIKNLGDIADIKRGLASQHLNYVENANQGVRLIRINDFKSNSNPMSSYVKSLSLTY